MSDSTSLPHNITEVTIQKAAYQLKHVLEAAPSSIEDLNALLSPVAHLTLGPSVKRSDAVRSEPAVVPISNAASSGALHTAFHPDPVKTTIATPSNTMCNVSSSGEAGHEGLRRSSRVTKGIFTTKGQGARQGSIQVSSTKDSSSTATSPTLQTPAASSQSQALGPGPLCNSTFASNGREGMLGVTEQAVRSTPRGNEWPVTSAYPISLASRWSPEKQGGTAQRPSNRPQKRPRNGSVESLWTTSVPGTDNGSCDPTIAGPSNCSQSAKPHDVGTKYTIQSPTVARDRFRSRWAPVFPTFTDWARLDRHEKVGKRLDQGPYEELDNLMARVCKIGTLSVQTAFASSVATWLASPYAAGRRIQTPNHLQRIPGFDAAPFQKFWLAEEMARCSKGVEDMSIILRRKAMADFLCAYHEVVDHVRQRAAQGKIQLGQGKRAAAEARRILYEIIYPDLQSRSRARSFFNSSQTRGSPYFKLQKNYGSIGILAMIPTKIGEAEFRASDSLFNVFLELLDLLCPELHDTTRLNVYGKILELICRGETPEPQLMRELSLLTSLRQSK